MSAPHIAVAILATLPFLVLGTAKITGRARMPERAAHLGFTTAAYRRIGTLELLGAAGLLTGLALPALGLLAAACLLALLLIAIVLHLRNGDGLRSVAAALVSALLVVGYGVSVVIG